MNLSLQGHTALITGGSLGLGQAMARAFCAAGAKVAIVARRRDVLDTTADEIATATGGEIAGFACDVADGSALEQMHAAATERFGPIDILINNAGKAATRPFLEITDEDWQADLDLKVMAAVRLTRLVWPGMETRGWGRIVNVLNTAAKAPDARTAPTSVSRAAGMALTKVLSAEGAPHNILVNAMLIGFIKSDQIRRQHAASDEDISLEDFMARFGKRLPMGRMGEAEEVANLAHFLVSDAASYVTGCAINMDGGLSKVP